MSTFKLTYASMFNPPTEVHTRFEAAVSKVKSNLGKTYGMIINNRDHFTSATFENRSPINTDWVLARLQEGTTEDARLAFAASKAASREWSSFDWKDRVALVRRAANLVEDRMYELAVATTLNVGKNRLESLGDIQEGVELLRTACDSMEKTTGMCCKWEVNRCRATP